MAKEISHFLKKMVLVCADVAAMMLKCCRWLPGSCYGIAMMSWSLLEHVIRSLGYSCIC